MRIIAGHRRHEVVAGLLRCPRLRLAIACAPGLVHQPPQGLRGAAGCAASHSHCRGKSVTSRATTPSFGRPRPAGFGPIGAVLLATSPRSRNRWRMSSSLPRRSRSITLPVASSKVRKIAVRPLILRRLHHQRDIRRALPAQAFDRPRRLCWVSEKNRSCGSFLVLQSIFTRIKCAIQYHPGKKDEQHRQKGCGRGVQEAQGAGRHLCRALLRQ